MFRYSLDPDDLKIVAHLVAAYSQIDREKSEQYPLILRVRYYVLVD